MTYQEALQAARGNMGPCKACPICNGLACGNTVPGPGAKGSGTGAHRNYEGWQNILLNMDTICENRPVDTSVELFGKKLSIPVMAAPIATVINHYGDKLDEKTYTDALVSGCQKAGIAPFLGDSMVDYVFPTVCDSMQQLGWSIPTIKPWNMEVVKQKLDICKEAGCFAIAMDIASSEFYDKDHYVLKTNGDWKSADDMINWYDWIINNYPVASIEDGLAENDWANWKIMTERLGKRVQLVGDDLFVTNVELLEKGINEGIANAILIKPNQIGSLSETIDAVLLAKKSGYNTIMSHRSGETEDSTIADIAVATNSGQIKTGSLSRSDRMAKYNQLLRIEEELGKQAVYGWRNVK